jgi:hypothetical protein
MKDSFSGYISLVVSIFFQGLIYISVHALLAFRVSAEKSAIILMGLPLYMICCFFLADFNMLCFLLYI